MDDRGMIHNFTQKEIDARMMEVFDLQNGEARRVKDMESGQGYDLLPPVGAHIKIAGRWFCVHSYRGRKMTLKGMPKEFSPEPQVAGA